MLRNFINQIEFADRTRMGVNGTLQYRLSPELTFTVDGLIYDQRERFHGSGIVPDFSGGTFVNQVVVGGTKAPEMVAGLSQTVQTGGRAVSQTYANGTVDQIVINRTPRSTTTLIGVNTKWKRGPFAVSLDLDTGLARYRNAEALFTTIRMKGIDHTFDTRTGSWPDADRDQRWPPLRTDPGRLQRVRPDGRQRPADGCGAERDRALSPLTPLSFRGSYSNFLPSLNVRLNLTDNLILRRAGSRVLSRPTLADLSSIQAISSSPGNERIWRGNPNLQPFKAWQFEAGLEWYYTRESLGRIDIQDSQTM